MSALSIIVRDREVIFRELYDNLLKQGRRFVLRRDFALGLGWSKPEVHFLYQYLDLFSNFSPDVETLFIDRTSVDIETQTYTLKGTSSGIVSRLEFILKQFSLLDQDNISTTIYVSDENLAPYSGTLEEKIALYVTSLGYTKEAIDSEIWVEYTGTLWT